MEEKKKTTSVKYTEAAKLGASFPRRMYAEALKGEKPVAWAMAQDGAFPIFQAMDVLRVFPENYGTVCAAKRMSIPYLDICSGEGFSRYLCAYLRTDTGFIKQYADRKGYPPDAPWGGLAKPAMFIGLIRARLCDEAYKYLVHGYQRYYPDVPAFFLDIPLPPSTHDYKEVTRYYIRYIAEQYRALAAFVERVVGKKMDQDRLEEAMETYLETTRIWYETYNLRKALPCPMPAQDSWAVLAASYWWPSDKEVLEYNRKVLAEVKERVDKKIGAAPEEKYRLMWTEGAPWHSIMVLDRLLELGAIIVIEGVEYAPGPPPEIPPGADPYEKMAWRHWANYASWFGKSRDSTRSYPSERYLEWAKEYMIDGLLLHHVLDCRAISMLLPHIRNVIMESLKVPSYLWSASMVDTRESPSPEKIMSDMKAFFEVMDHYKKIRQEQGLPVAHA